MYTKREREREIHIYIYISKSIHICTYVAQGILIHQELLEEQAADGCMARICLADAAAANA